MSMTSDQLIYETVATHALAEGDGAHAREGLAMTAAGKLLIGARAAQAEEARAGIIGAAITLFLNAPATMLLSLASPKPLAQVTA
jgi:hypothetical protein